jgi:hypothetical protein
MRSYLTIEMPDETLAEALRRHLHAFDVDKVEVDAHWELRVHLLARNSETRVTTALHAIESWLPMSDIDFVQVHLDGTSYTLHSPPKTVRARPRAVTS